MIISMQFSKYYGNMNIELVYSRIPNEYYELIGDINGKSPIKIIFMTHNSDNNTQI